MTFNDATSFIASWLSESAAFSDASITAWEAKDFHEDMAIDSLLDSSSALTYVSFKTAFPCH